MPQLMPLMWMFSSLMVALIFMSACMVYSGDSKKVSTVCLNEKYENNSLWSW